MRRTLASRLLQISLLATCTSLGALAADPAPAKAPGHVKTAMVKVDEARAMLDKAAAALKKNPKAALAAFNNPAGPFQKGEYYVFALKLNGDFVASGGGSHALVGMNTASLRDASGKPFMQEILDTAKAKGAGSVDYVWLNRATNRVENKTTLFKKVGGIILAVGYYTPRETAEQAEALLNEAAYLLDTEGVSKAVVRFNDPKGGFIRDDLYVYVVGTEDAKFYANGASPSLVGLDARNLRDAAGTPLVQEMLDKAKDSGSGTEDYVWRNSVTNEVENKHAIFRRIGKYLVAVGYYSK